MEQYKISIKVKAEDAAAAKNLADHLQAALQVVEHSDIVKLLAKVAQKPGLVKTALKFV